MRLLLPALAFFLAGMSPLIFYGVSAQSSAATCTASLQALQAACGTDTSTVATCCPVYKAQVNAYPDCYCSLNSTILLQLATTCSFTLPQNLTSCFTAGTYIHTYIHTYTHCSSFNAPTPVIPIISYVLLVFFD